MGDERITEKKIIEFLIQKRSNLLDELKKIELAIEALDADQQISHNYFEKSIPGYTSKEGTDVKSRASGMKYLTAQKNYNPNGRFDQKISFALTQLGSGTKDDIIEVLSVQQPDMNKNKFEKSLSVRLSYLLKNDFIVGKKTGRIYSYHLK